MKTFATLVDFNNFLLRSVILLGSLQCVWSWTTTHPTTTTTGLMTTWTAYHHEKRTTMVVPTSPSISNNRLRLITSSSRSRRKKVVNHNTKLYNNHPNIFFGPEEEFECPDEEECEIDWDAMPGFGPHDDDVDESNSNDMNREEGSSSNSISSSNSDRRPTIASNNEFIVDDEVDIDLQPRYDPTSAAASSSSSSDHSTIIKDPTTAAVHLEMNWQIDECQTDEESCSDFCPDCAGSGHVVCKFCRGTKVIAFGGDFRPCLLCHDDGHVDCPTCRGTGKISSWAKTHDDHINNNLPRHHRH